MFLKIDARLIIWANWCVRQVELYTSSTRKTLYTLYLFLMKCLSVITATCVVLLLIIELNMLHGLFLLSSIGQIMDYSVYKSLSYTVRDDDSVLPFAIITRKIQRMIVFTEICLLLPSYLVCIIIQDEWYTLSVIDVVLSIAMSAMMLYVICSMVVEYILCTFSIPPAERVRREYMRQQNA